MPRLSTPHLSAQGLGHAVGPAVLQVGGAAPSVGDGVAEHGHGPARRPHVDFGNVIPVHRFLYRVEPRPGLHCAPGYIGMRARTAVGGGIHRHPAAVADGHGQPLQGFEGIVEGIAIDGLAGRNGHRAAATKRQIGGCAGIDVARVPCIGDVDRLDFHRLPAEFVGQLHLQPTATERHLHDLPQGGVGQRGGLGHIALAGKLRCRSKRAHPLLGVGCGQRQKESQEEVEFLHV